MENMTEKSVLFACNSSYVKGNGLNLHDFSVTAWMLTFQSHM